LGAARLLAKLKAAVKNKGVDKEQRTYKLMQYTWQYSLPKLPRLNKHYDVAVSFLGPHNFILDKVQAKLKFGWNHTDYFSLVNPDKALDEKMWSRLDYIVNVSKDCEESFLKVFPGLAGKAMVLENIISPAFVRQQSDEDARGEMADDDSVKICSVGRLSGVKGFDMAVMACKRLVQAGYNIVWYVVGYGAEEERIKQLVRENGLESRFILLGKKVNPYPYIKGCDIYCQPSRYEGKAVTVREAQILAKPVVITNFPTANSQLTNGVDGYICELSEEGIARGVETLIKDTALRSRLSGNCTRNDYGNQYEIQKLEALIGAAQ
jgi:glycosyltransferase involved in cell wall biosynthesis